ncbi:MAG: aminopeptidase P N-terminal domain-containing protein [Gammaproteobacteria bacterium]
MSASEFARRRRQLMRLMGERSIAILPAAPERSRNRDVVYPFRQDSDFVYLTNFTEPQSVAVLVPGRDSGEFILFCRDRDPERETWDGRRAGQEGAVRDFGADDAFGIEDIDDILPGLMEHGERVFYTMGIHPQFDQQMIGWMNTLRARGQASDRQAPQEIVALDHLLHDMRLYKSRSELVTMRRSAKIATTAHERGMRVCRPGLNEAAIEAEHLHEFRRHGATWSYPPIVGGGENGCILHYIENNQPLNDGDLVLVDAGCELDYYASDITRTFPVNGRFSAAQRTIYNIVLDAQLASIEAAVCGNDWNAPHLAAVKTLTKGLLKVGLLEGTLKSCLADESYKRFYMHRTSHWLGMDVHDVGDYRVGDTWRELEPGMVLTIEPGIYIPPGMKGVAKKWWGIGVRIEDDVAVTRKGPDVLSKHLVKTVDDIEALMANA